MAERWLLYGAYGYTGRLIAAEAVKRGLSPMLAGRREQPLKALGEKLGLEWQVLDLSDAEALAAAFEPFDLVLNCAGPFVRTARPVMTACLQSRTHYLDITGEIEVFRTAHGQDADAREAGIALVPGTGFDVVPTDCLAMKLAEALPDARDLVLAFEAHGGWSPGTARTSIQGLAHGGYVRRGGELKRVPLAWKVREFVFKNRRRKAVTIPWGDVYTAYVSTGIPNIEVYMSAPSRAIRTLRIMRWFRWILALPWVQRYMQRQAGGSTKGPDEGRRARTFSYILGQVKNGKGDRQSARMITPNGYALTVEAALGIVKRGLEQGYPAGFHTPGQLMGTDYAESLPGVEFKIDEE